MQETWVWRHWILRLPRRKGKWVFAFDHSGLMVRVPAHVFDLLFKEVRCE